MATIYISPTGSGDKSGSSIENAASILKLDQAISNAGPGGKVLLIADQGDYTNWQSLLISHGGTADAPVTISGISSTGEPMAAHFTGTRSETYTAGMDSGNQLFRLYAGADHLVFQNLDIDNTGTVFRVAGSISDLTIENVTAENVERFFENNTYSSSSTADIDGLTIRNVDVEGFSKGVIRLQYDTHDVLIDNVTGDGGGQNGDNFAIGIHLEDTVHDVVIRDTTMTNVQQVKDENSYWNADAFATERGVYNVTFIGTTASGSTDSGYDLKSTSTTLINVVSEDNGKNFKLWGEVTLINPTGIDAHIRGGTAGQVQVYVTDTADVSIIGGSFSDASSDSVVFYVNGTLSLDDVTVTAGDDTRIAVGKTATTLDGYVLVSADDAAADTPTTDTGLAAGDTTTGGTTADGTTTDSGSADKTDADDGATGDAVPADTGDTAPATVTAPFERQTWHLGTGETIAAHDGQDIYRIDAAAHTGTLTIYDFASQDVLFTNQAYKDSDGDRIISFGGDKLLNESDGDALSFGKGINSVRYIGETEDGQFAYASAATKLKGATEGLLGDDALHGDAAGQKAETFFFDTALHLGLGQDSIRTMGAEDRIVTTEALATGSDGRVLAGDQGFALHDGNLDDHVSIYDLAGDAVLSLVADGDFVQNGVHYYSYVLPDAPL